MIKILLNFKGIFFYFKKVYYICSMEQHNDNQNTNLNSNYTRRLCANCGKTDEAIDSCETCKPKGMLGWVCPVCGTGNSPFSSTCPCKSFGGQIRYQDGITDWYSQQNNTK
jgi:hypothetical protein